MKIYTIFFFITVIYGTKNAKAADDPIQCPCPTGINVECTKQPICVYGINDDGKIFHNGIFPNGNNDIWELTKIALQRKAEISNASDDILVNLYNPFNEPWVIFYYGCRECLDLKEIKSAVKLKIFLLSLYNQRMKYNIRYAQSDFKYFFDNPNEQQPMPEITVRPFWMYRLMLNQTCAHQKQGFTQKHFIPAFLTQDLCVLDFKFLEFPKESIENQIFHTTNGEITYSSTLSSNGLYSYDILANSTKELPSFIQDGLEICKAAFLFNAKQRLMRYFCICNKFSCTLKVAQKDPIHFCPYKLKFTIDYTLMYKELYTISDYLKVDDFFLDKNGSNRSCFFAWRANYYKSYDAYILRDTPGIPYGYTIKKLPKMKWFCQFVKMARDEIIPFNVRIFKSDTWKLREPFVNAVVDHSKIINDIQPIGANCTSEGPLSDPFYSSGYGSNASMFPCYKYYDMNLLTPIFPIIGINMLPIKVSKGKECYYYAMKKDDNHFNLGCLIFGIVRLPPIMEIVACPENSSLDMVELKRFKNVFHACPTMNSNQTQWGFVPTKKGICGQFLRGLKLQNGAYLPKEIEFREATKEDFKMTGMFSNGIVHGCGFNSSQQLTLCTCYSYLGGCDNLYTAGRAHILRYLPFESARNDT